ncbi:tetraacyldisaccharide 4'-kinase [Olleya aquimaris]|uniref:Tetraacyldisaccharide 4'-kinase n=1 Tax=Olleya aquimaris TaxID=639310 RepID=A0A327RE60_9FLAO|nr:tetraacyldisaccharide 4'-kinase [Olleya aquimaris]RAJ14498.1 lipid-A-disaccharide kinase [Olleya aquimaris]
MKLLRIILFPIVPIYYIVTWIRNVMYDKGWKQSKQYDFPVICVGNLSAGGTGKTPMVEYLIRVLKDKTTLATLSRGYGRKSEGFILADANVNAEILGDEPYQFYHKFSEDILVAVDANRQEGISKLLDTNTKPEVILLDDAFQHRKVKAGLNILLTTYTNLYTRDIVLPTGNLREPKSGAKRADLIVVTKCPIDLSATEKQSIIAEIQPLDHQQVFFSTIAYSDEVVSEYNTIKLTDLKDFKLVTGIANPKPLIDFLKGNALNFEHIKFKDHHAFSIKEIDYLSTFDCIVTTEKDYMRLKDKPALKGKLYYLPIQLEIDNAKQFNSEVTSFAKL